MQHQCSTSSKTSNMVRNIVLTVLTIVFVNGKHFKYIGFIS